MSRLDGYTQQSRGQRLNGFIAEILGTWDIQADVEVRSHGEIDVAFDLAGRQFVVEAKWEANRTDTGAVAKLQKRVRQRLGGTVGVLISIAGFTKEALNDLKDGEQLMVLCLTRRHLEAILSGFVSPEELFSEILKKAARRGLGHSEIENLFELPYRSNVAPIFESPAEIQQLVLQNNAEFNANIVMANLPFGQSGIVELSANEILITTLEGLFLADLRTQTVTRFLAFPNCSRNPIVDSNGSVYIVRNAGIARIDSGKIEFVAGGLVGNVSLSMGKDGSIWAFSNGRPSPPNNDSSPRAVQVGKTLGNVAGVYDYNNLTVNGDNVNLTFASNYTPTISLENITLTEGKV